MKGIGIAILLMLMMSIGCATPYARQWQPQLWQAQEKSTETPEIGRLKTETLTFDLLVTRFWEPNVSLAESIIGVTISSRNQTQGTLLLESNPIQVVDATNLLVKPLPIDYVMYQLYGGKLREGAQLGRLSELSQPLGSSFLETVIEAFRTAERQAIVTEIHRKEALPYDLYYRSFDRTSLPPRVATVWTEYFPYTTDKITVMLQGQQVEEGITFGPPPPPPKSPEHVRDSQIAGVVVTGIMITYLAILAIANK